MQIPHLLSYMEIRGFSHFSWNRDLSLRVCIAENFTSISYVSMCMAKKFASEHKYAKTRISKSHGYENHENEDFQQPKSSRTYNCETCVFQDTGKLMRNPKDLIAMHDLRLLGSQYIKEEDCPLQPHFRRGECYYIRSPFSISTPNTDQSQVNHDKPFMTYQKMSLLTRFI